MKRASPSPDTLREGEQKLRAGRGSAPDLLFVLDEDGTYIDV
jgi:hypothetical protein